MEPGWDQWQLFLALAEGGSTAAAARRLGQTQPTLSRQLATLEAALGVALFERHARGLRLTARGEALLPAARQMREAAQGLSLALAAQDDALAGTVRLTASEVIGAHFLPPVLAAFQARHPEVQIELVATDSVQDLLARNADIALRMARPEGGTLIARRLRDWPLGLFAHRDYLARRGWPTRETMAGHVWLGQDRGTQLMDGFRAAGFAVDAGFFAWRCDQPLVNWEACRAGAGICVGMEALAARDPGLERVLAEVAIPPLPMWLTAHRELRDTQRLRRVFDALAAAFATP